MDGDGSRIPVYAGAQRPAETQVTVPSKKQCTTKTADLEFSKDPNFNFGSSIPADGVFKAGNQGLPKSAKKVEQFSRKATTRGPLNRYKLEAELKTKNELLETAKQHLHSRLTEAQAAQEKIQDCIRRISLCKAKYMQVFLQKMPKQWKGFKRFISESTIKELREENDSLVQEVENLKKFQETCMVILESRNIDPVTGSNVLEQEEETQECQKQTTLLTEKLLKELRLFNQTCAKEAKELQAVMDKWKSAEEESQRSLENHSSFQAEMKEYMTTLDELERLLEM